jgi:2-dehydropantoate 2-reductase
MNSPSSRARATVAVIGLGAIGGIASGCLLAGGRHDIVACVRQPLDRLTLDTPNGTQTFPLRALTDPGQAQRVDWVILATKAYQTASVAPWLARLCDASTRVAVLQNGMGHVERTAPIANGAAVVPALVYYNGERLAPDHVRMRPTGERDLSLPDDADGHAFAQLVAGTMLRVELSADFRTLAWRKLLINAIANPTTALTSQRQAIFRRPDIHALCVAILEETIAVARADGAQLAPDEIERSMATLLTYPPEAGTSMYFDRLAGRELEVEAITGAIVAAGERLHIPTPLNRALLAMLRVVSDAAAGKDKSA